MDILSALKQSQNTTSAPDTQERVMIDGMLSICDEVFELELYKLGVPNDVISDRLREPVETREAVIKMYERGVVKND